MKCFQEKKWNRTRDTERSDNRAEKRCEAKRTWPARLSRTARSGENSLTGRTSSWRIVTEKTYIMSRHVAWRFFKTNCDFKLARIAQKLSNGITASYRHQIHVFRKPLYITELLFPHPQNDCFVCRKRRKNVPKQSILQPHLDYLAASLWLFCSLILTILQPHLDYFAASCWLSWHRKTAISPCRTQEIVVSEREVRINEC